MPTPGGWARLGPVTIRVFLVDDHEIVRRGLSDLINREDDMVVVGEAGRADEAAAREALKQGRYEDAIAAYNASIGTNPSAKYPLYLNIADIASTMGRPDKIEEALSQYQKFEPNNPRVLLGLGDLASQRKDYKIATQSYARALMTAKEPVMQRDIRKHFGYACQMLGDYPQAEALYKEVLREEPQAKDIQKNLAIGGIMDGTHHSRNIF